MKTKTLVDFHICISVPLSFVNSRMDRSSRSQMFLKIDVLKNFANFTGKHPCWSLFLIKLQAFFNEVSCEISQFSKNTSFYRPPPVAASGRGL